MINEQTTIDMISRKKNQNHFSKLDNLAIIESCQHCVKKWLLILIKRINDVINHQPLFNSLLV